MITDNHLLHMADTDKMTNNIAYLNLKKSSEHVVSCIVGNLGTRL